MIVLKHWFTKELGSPHPYPQKTPGETVVKLWGTVLWVYNGPANHSIIHRNDPPTHTSPSTKTYQIQNVNGTKAEKS